MTIVDDFSKFTWVFLIASKSDTLVVLRNFFTQVNNLFSTSVKTFRIDNGSEFFLANMLICVYLPRDLSSKYLC